MIEPNLDASRQFLDALEPGGRFCFQTFDDSGEKRPGLVWQGHGTIEEHALHLADLNEQGAGVFVTVNRTDGQGRKETNVTGIRALFVDGDDQEPPTEWHMPPSIIVRRDVRHWHAYWVLLPIIEDLEWFKPAQMALIQHYKTDAKIKDLPRVMRIPGFLHRKGEPVMVEIAATSTPYATIEGITHNLARPVKAPRVSVDAMMSRALSRSSSGRNEAGFWLACQLRDNLYTEAEASKVLADFSNRVPQGGDPYSPNEAEASVRQAYKQPAREPWSKSTQAAPVDDLASYEPNALQEQTATEFGVKIDTTRWNLSDKGVAPMEYKEGSYSPNPKRLVAGRPIWPRKLGRDHVGRPFVELAWRDSHGTIRSQWIDRESLSSRETLFALTDAPVSLGRINSLSDYLVDACGGVIAPPASVTSHLGWAGDRWVWCDDPDYSYIGSNLPSAGKLAAWAEGVRLLACEDRLVALACLGMSAAAPLVRLLDCRAPVFGLEEHSSTGKSTVIRYAISIWTAPDLLTLPASSTAKGIQDKAMWLPDGPILIEDVQQLDERDPQSVADVIYFIANGQRRVTSSRSQEATGGEKRYGCAFYAAERNVLGSSNLGVQYRVIQLIGSPLGSAQEAAALAACTRESGAPARSLFAIYNQEREALVARVREIAAGYEFQFALKGADCETLAMVRIGLELLGRVCSCEIDAVALAGRLGELLENQRRLTEAREEEALAALITCIEGCVWDKDGCLYSQEQWVAYRIISDGGELVGYEINLQSKLVKQLLTEFGGTRRLTGFWVQRSWIAQQGGRPTIVSGKSGAKRRVMRVTKAFLTHLEREKEAQRVEQS